MYTLVLHKSTAKENRSIGIGYIVINLIINKRFITVSGSKISKYK